MAALQTKLPRITLVTDPQFATSAAWGVHVPGAENPTPTTFIVAGGTIRWRYLANPRGDWPTYAELASALAL